MNQHLAPDGRPWFSHHGAAMRPPLPFRGCGWETKRKPVVMAARSLCNRLFLGWPV